MKKYKLVSKFEFKLKQQADPGDFFDEFLAFRNTETQRSPRNFEEIYSGCAILDGSEELFLVPSQETEM